MNPPSAPTTSITRGDVDHLAQLSAVSLGDDEADAMVRELGRIVAFVQELSAVDTSDVGEVGPAGPGALREDVVVPGLTHEEALREAPRVSDGGFAVAGFVSAGTATPGLARTGGAGPR